MKETIDELENQKLVHHLILPADRNKRLAVLECWSNCLPFIWSLKVKRNPKKKRFCGYTRCRTNGPLLRKPCLPFEWSGGLYLRNPVLEALHVYVRPCLESEIPELPCLKPTVSTHPPSPRLYSSQSLNVGRHFVD